MKNLLALLALSFLFIGCHVHSEECYYDSYWEEWVCTSHHAHHAPASPTTTVVYTSANNGGGYNNNIIVVEEEAPYCYWDMPYYHDPEWCEYTRGETYCMWMNIGQEEIWVYTDWCGWELVEVYTYY